MNFGVPDLSVKSNLRKTVFLKKVKSLRLKNKLKIHLFFFKRLISISLLNFFFIQKLNEFS